MTKPIQTALARGLTLAAIALGAGSALAQSAPHPLAHAGLWDTYSATDADNHQLCGIATTGADGRRIAIEQSQGEPGLTVSLTKSSWAIPAGTPVDLDARFDTGSSTLLHATGAGSTLSVVMSFDQTVPFMKALRYDQQMQVSFPSGNEPVWTGGLSGSSRAIDAFNDCRHSLAPLVPTQPFTPAASPSGVPTQPFTAPTPPPVATSGLPPLPAAPGKQTGG